MSKPYLFVCFDTEDPIHHEADDAVVQLAQLYETAGMPACFFVVGERARQWRLRGRRDVIQALRPHEVNYHGNYWFEFPEPALLYGNRLPWDQAVSRARDIELAGLTDIAEITGQFPLATVQHQNNYSPATQHALRQAGVRVWNGGTGAPAIPGINWLMDLLVAPRFNRSVSSQGSIGSFQWNPLQPSQMPPVMNEAEELKTFQQQFEQQLEQGHAHLLLLGHPTCWATGEWWGWYEWSVPFRVEGQGGAPGAYPSERQWQPITGRLPEDKAAHMHWTAAAARWIAGRNDIHMATFKDLLADYEEPRGVWLTHEDVHAAAQAVLQRLDAVQVAGTTLSCADLLFVLAQYVEFVMQQHRLPEQVQVRRTLGPVQGVLVPREPVTLKRQDYLMAAREVVHYVNRHQRLPHAVRAHTGDCGPREVLLALAQAVTAPELPLEITVAPGNGLPECASQPMFSSATAQTSNAPAGYEPTQIALQCKLQSWSFRPGVRRG